MIKKFVLLGTMAMAAAAFVIPASASAATFFMHEGGPISPSGETVAYTGNFAITKNLGGGATKGIQCGDVTSNVVVEESAAHVASFSGKECVGTGAYSSCTVENGGSYSSGLPWDLEGIFGEELEFLKVSFGVSFAGGCELGGTPIPGFGFTDDVTARLTTPGSLDELVFEGEIETPQGPFTVSGTLNATNKGYEMGY